MANVTSEDAEEFLSLAARMRIEPEIQGYSLEEANQALVELKSRQIKGTKVLRM